MSEGHSVPGGDTSRRIGDQEREAATEALTAHREAGRLDPEEFEDRQVAVAQARTWADIQPLFTDLPAPHPAGMPLAAPGVHALAQPRAEAPLAAPDEAQGFLGGVVPDRYKTTVMALTPFAALLLFFLTPGPGWLWFLAIPIMGILLYGPEGDAERKRRERLARDERRRRRREDRRG